MINGIVSMYGGRNYQRIYTVIGPRINRSFDVLSGFSPQSHLSLWGRFYLVSYHKVTSVSGALRVFCRLLRRNNQFSREKLMTRHWKFGACRKREALLEAERKWSAALWASKNLRPVVSVEAGDEAAALGESRLAITMLRSSSSFSLSVTMKRCWI